MIFQSIYRVAPKALLFLIANTIIYAHFSYVQSADVELLAVSVVSFFLCINTFHLVFQKPYKVFLYILMAFFMCINLVYFLGNYFTGQGISYALLNHLSLDSLVAGTYSFTKYHLGMIAVIATYIFAFFIGRKNEAIPFKRQIVVCSTLGLLGVALHPGSHDLISLRDIISGTNSDKKIMELYKQSYIPKERIQEVKNSSEKLPNVLLIFLEGIERTYLDNNFFPGLATNLSELEKSNHSYTNVKPVFGASHTIAGMVSSLCGMPFSKLGGANYQHGYGSVYMPKAQCLGDITKELGYQNLYYQGARLSFSRKGSFYKAHGYDEVKGMKFLKKITPNASKHTGTWGVHDDVLFDSVLNRLSELKKEAKGPFFMTLLNLDTHDTFSQNFLSRSCKENGVDKYTDSDHDVQHAIHCTDHLVFNFIKQVSEDWGDDLEIYLVSDHLEQAYASGDKLLSIPILDRKLIFSHLTGEKKENAKALTNFDIAPTILSDITDSKIQHLGLGVAADSGKASLREESGIKNLNKRLTKSINGFAKLVWKYPSFKDNNIFIKVKEKKVEIGEENFDFPIAFMLDDNGGILDFYTSYIHLSLGVKKQSPRVVYINDCKQLNSLAGYGSDHNVSGTSSNYCMLIGNLGSDKISISPLEADMKLRYEDFKDEINSAATLANYNRRLYETNHLHYKQANMFSYGTTRMAPLAKIEFMSRVESKHRFVTSYYFLKGVKQKSKYRNYHYLESGLHLFSVSEGVATHLMKWNDCENEGSTKSIKEFLKKKKSVDYIVLTSGKGLCNADKFKYFEGTPFHKDISSLKPSTPYVGYYNLNNGEFHSKQANKDGEVIFTLVNNSLYLKKPE